MDADAYFVASTGLSKSAFKRKHGAEKLRSKELESTQALLSRQDKDCVIACGPYIAAEQLRSFMIHYGKTHPIIYVIRPVNDIEEYLGLQGNSSMHQWMDHIHKIYRSISNFDFFNLPERWKDNNQQSLALERLHSILSHRMAASGTVQTLQTTQTTLAKFLAAALGRNVSSLSTDIFPTLYPHLPELRSYSNCLCISILSLVDEETDISRLTSGADVIELIIDPKDPRCAANSASGVVGRFSSEIRRFFAIPIIYHVQMENIIEENAEVYFGMLYEGLRLAPEYLTVDLRASDVDIRLLTSRRGFTTIVGHQDSFGVNSDFWQSPEPLQLYNRAVNLNCGVVRFAKPCKTVAENCQCLTFIEKINALSNSVPIIAHATGDLGRLSLICNSTLTPVSRVSSRGMADSSRRTNMTLSERWSSLFTLRILDPLQFSVVGDCVPHSLSPAMHNAAFQALGMPHVYNTFQTSSLDGLRRLFASASFGGASISLPFKQEVLALVSKVSPSVELIGASNTILPVRRRGGIPVHNEPRYKEHRHHAGPVDMLYADNTDWMGICACLSRAVSPANSINPRTSSLVVGAGGIARASLYCLLYLGVRNICILNRTVSNARQMANHYEQTFNKFAQSKNHYSPQVKNSSESSELRIRVLESVEEPWPSDFSKPSLVIGAIKAYDDHQTETPPFTMPPHWMRNPTGGVVVEVRSRSTFLLILGF